MVLIGSPRVVTPVTQRYDEWLREVDVRLGRRDPVWQNDALSLRDRTLSSGTRSP
jgi:hypothetical protein